MKCIYNHLECVKLENSSVRFLSTQEPILIIVVDFSHICTQTYCSFEHSKNLLACLFCFTLYNRAVFHAITRLWKILKSTRAQPHILHKDFLLHQMYTTQSMENAILRVMHISALFGLDGGSREHRSSSKTEKCLQF